MSTCSANPHRWHRCARCFSRNPRSPWGLKAFAPKPHPFRGTDSRLLIQVREGIWRLMKPFDSCAPRNLNSASLFLPVYPRRQRNIAAIRPAPPSDTMAATAAIPPLALTATDSGRAAGQKILVRPPQPRRIVLTLIIDDGVRGRRHRRKHFQAHLQSRLARRTIRTRASATYVTSTLPGPL